MATHKYTVTNSSITWTISELDARTYARNVTGTIRIGTTEKIVYSSQPKGATTVTIKFTNLPSGAKCAVKASLFPEKTGTTTNYDYRTVYTTSDEMISGAFSKSATDRAGFLRAECKLNNPSTIPRKIVAYAQRLDSLGNKVGEEARLGVVWQESKATSFPSTQSAIFVKPFMWDDMEGQLVSVIKRLELDNGTRTLKTNTCPAWFNGDATSEVTEVTQNTIELTVKYKEKTSYARDITWYYKKSSDTEYTLVSTNRVNAGSKSTVKTFSNLRPYETYDIKYETNVDWVLPSTQVQYTKMTRGGDEVVTYRTLPIELNATLIETGQTTALIGLSGLRNMQGRRIEWYKTKNGSTEQLDGTTEFTITESSIQYSYTGLEKNSMYTFRVVCLEPMEDGKYVVGEQTIKAQTDSSIGSVRVTPSYRACTLEINIKAGSTGEHKYQCYVVGEGSNNAEISYSQDSITITNLEPETEYSVLISVKDSADNKLGNLKGTFTTLALAKEPPEFEIARIRQVVAQIPRTTITLNVSKIVAEGLMTIEVYRIEDGMEELLHEETTIFESVGSHTFSFDNNSVYTRILPAVFKVVMTENGHSTSREYVFAGNTFAWNGQYLNTIKWKALLQEQHRVFMNYDIQDEFLTPAIEEGQGITKEIMEAVVMNHNAIADVAEGVPVYRPYPVKGETITYEHFQKLVAGANA